MSIAVVKYGGTSQLSIEDIAMHAKVAKELLKEHDRIITVVSGSGDITDKVETAVMAARRYVFGEISEREFLTVTEPTKIFLPSKVLYSEIESPKNLSELREKIYRSFERTVRTILPAIKTSEEFNMHRAELNLYPEELQAALVNYVYQLNGLDSLCINFNDKSFPLVVEGHALNGSVNLAETRKRVRQIPPNIKERVIILPGYGGVDGEIRKTLGRGGSDAVAFAYAYAFQADAIWLFTDVDGIKRAIIDGQDIDTVKEISLQEAADGAFYGAKLPSSNSLRPLSFMYKEGLLPEVYIAHHKRVDGDKTKIVKELPRKEVVKFIAGRGGVLLYRIFGDVYSLLSILDKQGVDHFSFTAESYANIGLNQKGREQGESIIEELAKNEKINIDEKKDIALVGIIGEGMRTKRGIAARMHSRLSKEGVNIELMLDVSPFSTGVEIADADRKKVIESLYDEFFMKH